MSAVLTYERPTMAEVFSRPRNGLRAVGSFSGCGGSSLGLTMAGWKMLGAIEFVPEAAQTYRSNFPETRVWQEDIRKLDPAAMMDELGLKPGDLDLFEGSPPCASFSSAGARERGWGTVKKYSDLKQQTDDLFEHYCRMVEVFRPRAFIAENVPGMQMGDAKAYMYRTRQVLADLGYRVDVKILDASAFGVPQRRKRMIFVGIRNDQRIVRLRDEQSAAPWAPTLPVSAALPRYTLADALRSVREDAPDHAEFLESSTMEGYAVGRTWHAMRHGTMTPEQAREVCARCQQFLGQHEQREEFVGAVKKAKEEDAPPDLFADAGLTAVKKEGGRKRAYFVCANGERAIEVKDYFMLVVPKEDEPCPTLTATGAQQGAASVTHPTECRKFTPAEAKALSGFPEDFILTGSREQRYERVGRTVVPPLYEHLGKWLAGMLT